VGPINDSRDAREARRLEDLVGDVFGLLLIWECDVLKEGNTCVDANTAKTGFWTNFLGEGGLVKLQEGGTSLPPLTAGISGA
jgi:G:T-mismatch repair DNA endonuclease (very short patch repair protein)